MTGGHLSPSGSDLGTSAVGFLFWFFCAPLAARAAAAVRLAWASFRSRLPGSRASPPPRPRPRVLLPYRPISPLQASRMPHPSMPPRYRRSELGVAPRLRVAPSVTPSNPPHLHDRRRCATPPPRDASQRRTTTTCITANRLLAMELGVRIAGSRRLTRRPRLGLNPLGDGPPRRAHHHTLPYPTLPHT